MYTLAKSLYSRSVPQRPYRRRVMTLVMACRIVMPAFSTSFRDRPVVMHTLSAACAGVIESFTLLDPATVLSRVIKTPLASVCRSG